MLPLIYIIDNNLHPRATCRRENKSEYITLTLVTKVASPWQEDLTIKH
jgi:hypothetical protein